MKKGCFSMTPTLRIRLLGSFHLLSGETPVSGLDVLRLQSLLAYLLLHAGVPQSRAHLAYMFWPDSTDSQAHTNLRNLIHKIRQALPNADAYLQVERQTVFWKASTPDAPWYCDVLAFTHAITAADATADESVAYRALTRATKLYRGDLLPGIYDDWLLSERDRLRQMFLKALERLIELQEQERNYSAAISSLQQLLHYDPLQEATYRSLMRLYAISDDRAAALRTYHTCATTLERELGVQPSKATREVYERLRQSDDPSKQQKSPAPPALMAIAPLVGRQAEWAQLLATWRNTARGEAHCLLLSGEAGIGKTRLAEELINWVGRQGISTAIARCYAAEGSVAYTPVTAWLRSDAFQLRLASLSDIWLTEVARFLPHLLAEKPTLPHPGPLTEGWQRQRFFEALARATLQSQQPLLLLLDDVQWCDRETLEWLHFLLRFDPKAPLLLICTARSEELTPDLPLTPLLASLRRERLLTEVVLEPLTASETAYLAAHLSGMALNDGIVNALYQETEGNPLFVVETVRSGSVEKVKTGQLSLEALSARPGAALPPTVQAVILSRFAQLTSTAGEVMALAAVIGRAFTFGVLRQASTMDEDALVLGLDELWQRRVVREQGGDAYDFSHDKLREQAYNSLSNARKRLLHRRVADALVALHGNDQVALEASSGQIAAHYEQAGAIEQAIAYYMRAAAETRRVYANTEALAFYSRILYLLTQLLPAESKHEWRAEITTQCHESIGDILSVTGEAEAAKAAYQNALAFVPEQERIRRAALLRKISNVWYIQRDYEEALRTNHEAEAVMGATPIAPVEAWWQEWLELQDRKLDIYGLTAKVNETAEIVEQMRPIVQQYGTTMQRAEFFFTSALTTTRLNRLAVSEKDLESGKAGLAAYEALGDPLKIGWSHLSMAYLYQDYDLFQAEEHARIALALGERTGDTLLQLRTLGMLTNISRRRGNKEEVKRSALHILYLAKAMQQPLYVGLSKANLAWLAWLEGNLTEAQAMGQEALTIWQTHFYYSQWIALLPLLAIAQSQDRLSEAVAYARALLAPDQQILTPTLQSALETAIQAWDADQPDSTRTALQQLIVVAQESGYL